MTDLANQEQLLTQLRAADWKNGLLMGLIVGVVSTLAMGAFVYALWTL